MPKKNKPFIPTLKFLVAQGLNFSQACMLIESISSCAIEGIVTDKEGIKRLCKEIKQD